MSEALIPAQCPVDVTVSRLAEAERYLRDEADFNRSWTDGRKGNGIDANDGYKARRIALAEEREGWANAMRDAIAILTANAELSRPVERSGTGSA